MILQSTIERELRATFGNEQVDRVTVERARAEIIRAIAREELWIQIGKVIGREDPERFEQQIRGLVDQYMREEEDRYGSYTRMIEELRELDTSWQSIAAQKRREILGQSARQHAISQRYRQGFNLLVTPREMLDYFEGHAAEFEAQDSADVEARTFPKGEPDAAERAAAAAIAWREQGESAAAIGTAHGGRPLSPMRGVEQSESDPRASFVKGFAAGAAAGEVSEPIDRGAAFFVLRLAAKHVREARRFDDPQVQTAIRETLRARKFLALEGSILEWKARQILIMPPDILRPR